MSKPAKPARSEAQPSEVQNRRPGAMKPPKRAGGRRVLLVLAALALAGAGYAYGHLRAMASVGAGYVAKELCSCVFVAGRSLASCRPDVPESMDRVEAELLPDGVRGFVPALAERVARYEPGFGCTLH
ncbi:MAG TPA: hypothetical protein VMS55_01355 [Myxococcota bacterium]|nr:hypothetical protein [Myxococcota bacterium]